MLEVEISGRWGDFALDATFESDARVTALFGRSGAGKTSIVEALAGLRRPAAGRVVVDDVVLFDSDRGIDLAPERRRLGYVFQDARLFPHMTVARNLGYGARRAPRDAPGADFGEVVRLLDLAPFLARRPADLSGGERQRVAIGRALLAGPRVLLMDEPLASLDSALKHEILPFIERLAESGATAIVYVTHAMEEVLRLADRLVLVSEGRIAAQGGVEELLSRLDLTPDTGRFDAGSAFACEVATHDERWDLSHLRFPGGGFWVPRIDLDPGARLRVRVRARDVSLALMPPERSSVLNVFAGEVIEVGATEGPQVDVLVDIGVPLRARITRRSLEELAIRPGVAVHAVVKAVAIDRASLGGGIDRPPRRALDATAARQ